MKSCLVACCLSLVAWAASAETKIGIIGCDTSHTVAFTQLINVEKDPDTIGYRVTHAYKYGSQDIVSCTSRYEYVIGELTKAGVKMCDSIGELIANVDCVLIETCDGRPHLKQALEVFASGKPCYIDKPIAADMKDTLQILRAAKERKQKVFCSSALRYTKAVKAAKNGEFGRIRGVDTFAPGNFEPTNSRYFWYGIHGADPLFAIMGCGCVDVTCVAGPDSDILVGRWLDGRTGTLRIYGDKGGYGGSITNDKGMLFSLGGYEGYKVLLVEILRYFKTGVMPISPEEIEEVYAFLEAARLSYERGGKTVTLEEARRLAQ